MTNKPFKPITHKMLSMSFMHYHIDESFPDDERFCISKWQIWLDRIEQGHKAEEARLHELMSKGGCLIYSADHSCSIPDDLYAEEIHQTQSVSRIMSGALIVAMWADMEHFLKMVLSYLEKRNMEGGIIQECKQPQELTTNNMKNSKLAKDRRFDFNIFIKDYRKHTEKNVVNLSGYMIVNAVRVMNNCFKHHNGHYFFKNEVLYDQIDSCLAERWGLKEKSEIRYELLPLQDIITSCHIFCEDLIQDWDRNKAL